MIPPCLLPASPLNSYHLSLSTYFASSSRNLNAHKEL